MTRATYKQTSLAFTFKYAADSKSSILISPFFLQTLHIFVTIRT